MREIGLPLSIRLGKARLVLRDLLAVEPGTRLELEQAADDTVEVLINDRVVARGEIVTVDGTYAVRIRELAASSRGRTSPLPESQEE